MKGKKVGNLVICLSLIFSLTACGTSEGQKDKVPSGRQTTSGQAVEEKKTEISAFVVKDGSLKEFTLRLGEFTDDERSIILKGCLINYNRI